ncbi:MAG TPA: biotin--[acetyl-CoA-carboxylase] ligase [Jatrophihabitans sp.]|nr:biotin--[acetyl-CoA-carboxylase] ligase [Jatrophihabitans sp.]
MDRPPLDAARLRERLAARWGRVEVVDETDSTNADLLADRAAGDRSLLVAEHQSAGRGRFDRRWSSPPRAGLTFSVLLRPSVPLVRWGWLPLLTGLALHEAVTEHTGVATSLKWPNDLLAHPSGGKLAGILAQSSGEAVVVGVGLNVDTTADELPVETATSLALCGAGPLDRTALLAAIAGRIDARVAQWSDCDGDAAACGLAAAYRAACSTIGRPVRVSLTGAEELRGQAVDVDDVGRLVLRTGSGEQVVGAGDVEHLRPA